MTNRIVSGMRACTVGKKWLDERRHREERPDADEERVARLQRELEAA